jgi:hypothetical protein
MVVGVQRHLDSAVADTDWIAKGLTKDYTLLANDCYGPRD